VIWVSQKKAGKGEVSLKVEDVMTMDVITMDEKSLVKEAAETMSQNEISCVVAARKGKAIGILTESDLLKRVIVEGKNAKKTKIGEIMSSPLEVVAPGTSLEEALQLMFQKKIKKLPVVEKNHLLGLVSLTDIARCQPAIIKILKSFAVAQDTPKSMKKVLGYYIV
jgi:CBS domain-containing protein